MLKKSLALLLLPVSYSAWSVIDMVPKMVEVEPGQPSTVTIVNKSEHMEFVSITLSRLLNPGVSYEQEQTEAVGMSRNPQLYAYPFRLSLSPGQSKKITLKPLAAVQQETVYRLDIKPVTALKAQAEGDIAGSVAVNLSFSALVRQLPTSQTSELNTTCNSEGVTLNASGTVRYAIKELTVDGTTLDPFNLYPGTPKRIVGKRIELAGKGLCRE